MNNKKYVYGNTAEKIDVRRAIEEEPTHSTLKALRSETKRQKKMNMSALYVVFLMVVCLVLVKSLVTYISLMSDNNAIVERISAYETQVNDLKVANDDEYSKMVNDVDLEEVRRIAVEELGMVYADSDQIITYTRENSDYVRQLEDLPN